MAYVLYDFLPRWNSVFVVMKPETMKDIKETVIGFFQLMLYIYGGLAILGVVYYIALGLYKPLLSFCWQLLRQIHTWSDLGTLLAVLGLFAIGWKVYEVLSLKAKIHKLELEKLNR